MFAFKLNLKKPLGGVQQGKDALFLYGIGSDRTVSGVKALEEKTGLKAVAMLNNGGNHHILLRYWYNSFPQMSIWLCPTRAHHTQNHKELRKDFASRWELADNTTTPHHVQQLFDYFDGIDVVLFNQLFVHADQQGGAWRKCGCETHTLSNMDFFKKMPAFGAQDSASDEPVFFFKPLKLILTGHHWEVCICII